MGTREWEHWDTCVGTWDSGTYGTVMPDIKYRDVGTLMSIAKVRGKCDISFFVKMCYLWSTLDSIVQSHIGNLVMFTQNIS